MTFFYVIACNARPAINKYYKSQLSFTIPAQWQVKEDHAAALGRPRYIGLDSNKSSSITIEIYENSRLQHNTNEDTSLNATLKRYADYFKKRDGFTALATMSPSEYVDIKRSSINGIIEKREMTFMDKKTRLVREFYLINGKTHTAFITLDTDEYEYSDTQKGFEILITTFTLGS